MFWARQKIGLKTYPHLRIQNSVNRMAQKQIFATSPQQNASIGEISKGC
jgi:hypothetical protein